MTQAWNYYVTSNNLLNELRGLTRNYPFSSEVLDDAKWRVSSDPESNRSWNYAWLVLVKMRDEYVHMPVRPTIEKRSDNLMKKQFYDPNLCYQRSCQA